MDLFQPHWPCGNQALWPLVSSPAIARPGSPSGLLCTRSFEKHSTASRLCATQMAPSRPPHGPEPTVVCATLRSLQHLQGKAMDFVFLQKYLACSNSQVREAVPARVHRQSSGCWRLGSYWTLWLMSREVCLQRTNLPTQHNIPPSCLNI